MVSARSNPVSDTSRAELFDSLGHPLRIKILQALEAGPLGFGELKRRVGIESNGNLQYHLGRLDGLLVSDASGNYVLTDDGREALRVVGFQGVMSDKETLTNRPGGRPTLKRRFLAGMTIALLIITALAGVAYWQQASVTETQKEQIGDLRSQVQALEQQISQLTSQVVELEGLGNGSAVQGMNLIVSVNSTYVSGNGSILVSADARDILPISVNVTGFGNWSVVAIGNSCGAFTDPVRIAVFEGNHTVAELTDLQPFFVTPQSCGVALPPPMPGYDSGVSLVHDYLQFQPSSDTYAEVTHWVYTGTLGTKIAAGPVMKGIASANLTMSANYLRSVPGSGMFTVVALGTWGQMVVTYIQVSP